MADFIEGRRAVEEALKAGVPIRKVYLQAPAKEEPADEAADSRTRPAGPARQEGPAGPRRQGSRTRPHRCRRRP
jgi:tRNA G18 (ribose-2'-O)-methylase SpoU